MTESSGTTFRCDFGAWQILIAPSFTNNCCSQIADHLANLTGVLHVHVQV